MNHANIKDQIKKGHELDNANYLLTDDQNKLTGNEVYIITVPTPLDKNDLPDTSYLVNASIQIAKFAINGGLVINESTSYPGTLREIVIAHISKLNNANFLYAAAPERIDPANTNWSIKNTPRVVAGIDEESTKAALNFYQSRFTCRKVFSNNFAASATSGDETTLATTNLISSNYFRWITNHLYLALLQPNYSIS